MYLNGATTRRLQFRSLADSDYDVWQKFFVNNINLPFLGLDLSLSLEEQSKSWIDRQIWRYQNDKFGHHALINRRTGEFVGQCGLLSQDVEGKVEIEVGYHILPEFWGKGFATEAACYCMKYAFENLRLNSLISIIDVRNKLSQRVAEKIGMQIEKQANMYGLTVFIYKIKNGRQ